MPSPTQRDSSHRMEFYKLKCQAQEAENLLLQPASQHVTVINDIPVVRM